MVKKLLVAYRSIRLNFIVSSPENLKIQLVAKGCTQNYSIDSSLQLLKSPSLGHLFLTLPTSFAYILVGCEECFLHGDLLEEVCIG